ncbi:hypothetical protein Scep_002406 [Stephania cephalantha]|uniref:Uncharacterized protein n=1 Tax=Stephania cephalantha TaxID=152367 RepID=A0AAP0Q4L6_9MAGN
MNNITKDYEERLNGVTNDYEKRMNSVTKDLDEFRTSMELFQKLFSQGDLSPTLENYPNYNEGKLPFEVFDQTMSYKFCK